jgi:hypothetical protein
VTRKLLIVVAVLAVIGLSLAAQSKNPLVGVWKLAEIDGKPVAGESVYIFTPRYFTRVHTLEKTRPPYKDAAKPTTDEIVAAYNTITANAGTYEISGDTFVVNVAIAKNPGNRGVSQQKRPFKVDGKTLTYTETVQGQLHTVKLTRLE